MVLTHVHDLDEASAASAVVFASRYVQDPLPRSDVDFFPRLVCSLLLLLPNRSEARLWWSIDGAGSEPEHLPYVSIQQV
jgi:hypothetical protein